MPELNAQNGDAACIKLATVFGHFCKMAEFATANETPSSSQNFIEVEIVSDEEFEMLDEAIRIAINMKGKICSCCQYKVKSLFLTIDITFSGFVTAGDARARAWAEDGYQLFCKMGGGGG